MSRSAEIVSRQPHSATAQCWNRIGMFGDASCPDLVQYVHCRHCPVYLATARAVLDRDAPVTPDIDRTARTAQEAVGQATAESIVVFRLGDEWLAVATPVVCEVAIVRPIHSLPHRRNRVVLGLANVRGELLIAVSLTDLLGLHAAPAVSGAGDGRQRLLVLRLGDGRVVCPVEEVSGVHHVTPGALSEAPATVARSSDSYSRGLLTWQQRAVGILDHDRLGRALRRTFA